MQGVTDERHRRRSSISGISGISARVRSRPISGASTLNGAVRLTAARPGPRAPGDSFLNSLSDAFGQLNGQLTAADSSMANFAAGGSATCTP